jgi:hypothetical protein
MLGGGEGFFLPADTPACEDEITLNCYAIRINLTAAALPVTTVATCS